MQQILPHRSHLRALLMIALMLLGFVASANHAFATSIMVGGNPISTNFTCNNGVANGSLLQVSTCPDGPQDGQIISFFVCQFEQMLNEVMSKVYCAVVDDAAPAIIAALTLLIVLTGATFLMGLLPFTAKELAILGAKFTLVFAFATQAEYMIGIGYTLFVSMSKEGIVMVFDHLMSNNLMDFSQLEGNSPLGANVGIGSLTSVDDVYRLFDRTLQNILNIAAQGEKEANQCQDALFTMLMAIAIVIPPLAAAGAYFVIKLLWMLLRAVFGYCQGLLGLTFLVVLSPIYVSFALFKPTRTLFDKWIKYLVSYGFQMVIVFAFLGMVFYILSQIADDLQSYRDLVKPYKQDTMTATGVLNFADTCGICEMEESSPKEKPACKEGGKVLPLAEMHQNEEFLRFMTVKVIAMVILFYVLDIMLAFVPEMAKVLAGPKYAGQLGGGRSNSGAAPGNMQLPFEAGISNTLASAGSAYARSSNAASGGIEAVKAAFSTGILADGGLVDGIIRSAANPNDPFRNPNNPNEAFDTSPASTLFGAAAALTGAAGAFGAMGIGDGVGGGTPNASLESQLAGDLSRLTTSSTPDEIGRVIDTLKSSSNVSDAAFENALESAIRKLDPALSRHIANSR